MSIASVLTRLSTAKTAIATAITTKGGTISEGDGFEDFATAISEIPVSSGSSGGGSGSSGSDETLKKLIDKSITSLTLPEELTTIGAYAFYGCLDLVLTSLPNGITTIGRNAFDACWDLALTSLPNGITTIGAYAFNQCYALSLVSLPNSIRNIDLYAFLNCSLLLNLEILFNGSDSSDNLTIGANAFKGTSLQTISFPNAVQVPTLSNRNAFTGIEYLNYEIRVPSNLLNDWKTATNWTHSSVVDHIVAISE